MFQTPPSLKVAMTPFPYAVAIDATLAEAGQLMAEHEVHHLPVTNEDHEIVGILSNLDLMAVTKGKRQGNNMRVRDVCVTDVYIVDLDEPIDNVVLTMAERHIGSAVVTRQGKLAGIFTWVDVCRCFGDYLRSKQPSGEGDDAA
ncbi:MAG: CBS domain-containing protein [Pseudomonadota bacterium]